MSDDYARRTSDLALTRYSAVESTTGDPKMGYTLVTLRGTSIRRGDYTGDRNGVWDTFQGTQLFRFVEHPNGGVTTREIEVVSETHSMGRSCPA